MKLACIKKDLGKNVLKPKRKGNCRCRKRNAVKKDFTQFSIKERLDT